VKVLFLVPHPDDESLGGLLPLRFRAEARARVLCVPLTLGSDPARRAARAKEFRAACRVLGFTARPFPPDSPPTPEDIERILADEKPDVFVFPHPRDGHPRHMLCGRIARAAIARTRATLLAAETEFWHPLWRPNLILEAAPERRDTLLAALRCHAGELARADYDKRYPAWLVDNVRRGAERVFPPGSPAVEGVAEGVLLRVSRVTAGRFRLLPPRLLRSSDDVASLLNG
jgi:LmbE family N-acetylglucosaminyl deacetylase